MAMSQLSRQPEWVLVTHWLVYWTAVGPSWLELMLRCCDADVLPRVSSNTTVEETGYIDRQYNLVSHFLQVAASFNAVFVVQFNISTKWEHKCRLFFLHKFDRCFKFQGNVRISKRQSLSCWSQISLNVIDKGFGGIERLTRCSAVGLTKAKDRDKSPAAKARSQVQLNEKQKTTLIPWTNR